jgi:hypothetical protein
LASFSAGPRCGADRRGSASFSPGSRCGADRRGSASFSAGPRCGADRRGSVQIGADRRGSARIGAIFSRVEMWFAGYAPRMVHGMPQRPCEKGRTGPTTFPPPVHPQQKLTHRTWAGRNGAKTSSHRVLPPRTRSRGWPIRLRVRGRPHTTRTAKSHGLCGGCRVCRRSRTPDAATATQGRTAAETIRPQRYSVSA